jgi:radical SAM protein (TIGR01212 family)
MPHFDAGDRFRSYRFFLRQRFAKRVQKISIDAGFTCPNRNGSIASGGCSFCNNAAFSGATAQREESITQQIRRAQGHLQKRYKTDTFIAYFQTNSNTYGPLGQLRDLYEEALAAPGIIGLAIGTRPDCLSTEILELLQSLGEKNYVSLEIGLESCRNATLAKVNRGHTIEQWRQALELIGKYKHIHTATHLIFGLPGDPWEKLPDCANFLNESGIEMVKFHQLQIVRQTELASTFAKKPFPLLSKDTYLDLVADTLEKLDPDIVVQRLVAECRSELLFVPQWQMSASEAKNDINERLNKRKTWQGRYFSEVP